eukprot:13937928-Alexandrium_andersonii.AAC.1
MTRTATLAGIRDSRFPDQQQGARVPGHPEEGAGGGPIALRAQGPPRPPTTARRLKDRLEGL